MGEEQREGGERLFHGETTGERLAHGGGRGVTGCRKRHRVMEWLSGKRGGGG